MTTADQTDRLKCADTLLSVHYRDITAKDITLSTAYSLADIAQSLRTIATRPDSDEIERLTRWKAEALPVLDGLQELGKALGLPLGERTTGPAALEAVERLTAERQAFVAAIGYGDGITEPAATLPELIDPLTDALDAAREHDECPVICDLCGEKLAATRCPECHGSGCLPNPQLAYLECGMCAGVGRIHEGCAEASYADLAQRAENAEVEVERLRESIAGSPNKAQRLASLVASSTRLVQIERDDARARAEKAEATIERARAAVAHARETGAWLPGLLADVLDGGESDA